VAIIAAVLALGIGAGVWALAGGESTTLADAADRIDGESMRANLRITTHYRGTVDVEDVAEQVGGETKARFEQVFGGRRPRIPVEAWIARDSGLPVRIRASSPPAADITVDILEYGVPVDVEPPPETTVIEDDDVPGFE
jgi:hypothetical protein